MADIILPNELPRTFPNGQADEALHPGNFQAEGPWGENSALKRAHNAANSNYSKANALIELRDNRVDDLTVHCRKVRDGVERWARERADNWQDAKDELKRERVRVEDSLKAKANLKTNPALLNATLGTFQSMSAQQRAGAIEELLTEGAGPVLAILAETPGVLTGLSKEQRDGIVVRAYEKADPASYALLQELDKSLVRAERASLAGIATTQKLLAGTDRFDKKIERAKAAEARIMN